MREGKDYSKIGHVWSTEDRRNSAIENWIRDSFSPEKACDIFNTLLGFYPLTEKDKEEIEAYQKKQQEEKLQKPRENLNQN